MASEMRRVAKALVARRSETFASRYPPGEGEARLAGALRGFTPKRMRYEPAWKDGAAGTTLEVRLEPSPATDFLLKSSSVVLTLLLAAGAWAMLSPQAERPIRFLVPLLAALGILVFPFVVAALGAQREAEEANLRRAIRKALVDADDKVAPPQRDKGED